MRVRSLLLCLPIVMAATWLYSQGGAYGTILGTVTDNSGASVASAGVDVMNIATNVAKHTETTSSGDFTVHTWRRELTCNGTIPRISKVSGR